MENARVFGLRVREVREWRGLTLREASGWAGRSFGFWGQIERGEKPVTSRKTLEAMAGALRVHPAELTGQPWTIQNPANGGTPTALRGIETALERYELGTDPELPVRDWPQIAEDLERLVTVMCGVWTTSIALELDEPDQALRLAQTVHPEALPPTAKPCSGLTLAAPWPSRQQPASRASACCGAPNNSPRTASATISSSAKPSLICCASPGMTPGPASSAAWPGA
ncbi:MAG: helix-turn-helix domain-containing protein [Pseudonocardiales bacterium]|nr:helix-turn-helix domain-containing protein [Pseudonocardiales bacterium]